MNTFDPNYVYKPALFVAGTKVVLVSKENKILVLKRSEKVNGEEAWSLPGGALEENESPLAGAAREVEEETGLKIDDLIVFDVNFHPSQRAEKKPLIAIGCKGLFPEGQEVKLNWEHTEYKFLTKEEALKLNLTPDGRFFVERS